MIQNPGSLRWWPAFLLVCALLTPAVANPDVPIADGAFTSGGKRISYHWYHASSRGRAPTVILLHGSGGLLANVDWMRHYGQTLALHGYHVFAVDYLRRTGLESVSDRQVMAAHFREWMRVVSDGITVASRKPEVDAGHIGLVGLSLGAYLSVSTATQDARVKAVVEYFGGLPKELLTGMHRMPPVLILHGQEDRVVPVDEATQLMGYLDAIKSPYESHIYPHEGHGFSGTAELDSEKRALTFLDRHLKSSGRPLLGNSQGKFHFGHRRHASPLSSRVLLTNP